MREPASGLIKGRFRERGFALVSVLLLITLLGVIAASFALNSTSQARLTRNLAGSAEAEALADAGVSLAILKLLEPAPDPTWPADGTGHDIRLPGGTVKVRIQDEGGKIDLNVASEDLLAGLFTSLGVSEGQAEVLADRLVDWRDEDDLVRANGAEQGEYSAAGYSYGPKNGPFAVIEELTQVPGITRELYAKAQPAITIYSGQRGVDPNVAPLDVLRALPGIDEASIAILLARREEARTGVTSGAAGGGMSLPRGYLSPSRRVAFTIRSEARAGGGSLFIREAVIRLVRRRGTPYVIADWRQGRAAAPVAQAAPVGEPQ